MKRTRTLIFLLLALLVFLILPFFTLLNRELAYYSYKEVVYETMIKDIAGKERDPNKIALRFLDYFHDYLFTPYEAGPVDRDVYSDLVRGIAWCDQRAWALGTFLGKVGIDNRLVMTRNPEGVSNHTVLEVYLDRRWAFFDPTYGLIIKDDGGRLASYEDICANPRLFYSSPSMLMVKEIAPGKYSEVKSFFTKNIFYNNALGPIVWNNPVEGKDFKRRISTKILHFYIYLFGNKFSCLYQDIYLKIFSPRKENEAVFFKARNYDLINRHKLAIDTYKRFADTFPEDPLLEDVLFFQGTLYNRKGNTEDSISTLQKLLKLYPETKWKRIGRYYLGYDYELLAKFDLARKYYLEVLTMYNQLGKIGLLPEEMKVIRRLDNLTHRKVGN